MFRRTAIFGAMAVALSFLATLPASAENRWVTIHNNTGYDIITFHGSHRDAKTWEEDILGSSILRAGQSVNINFDDGTGYCIFDFRAAFEDGDVLVKKGVNVCRIADFYYN